MSKLVASKILQTFVTDEAVYIGANLNFKTVFSGISVDEIFELKEAIRLLQDIGFLTKDRKLTDGAVAFIEEQNQI